MTKLIYSNYLKDKDFDYIKQYYDNLNTITKFKGNETAEQRYNRYLKSGTFREVFKKYRLKQIVLANCTELKTIINNIEDNLSKLTVKKKKNLEDKIKNIFNYSKKFQYDVVTPFFTNNFNFRTCFYCNKDFITNFEKEKEKIVSTFQLDHFYDKATYPYLALSFYNLIPSCPTCNSSKVKGSENCFNTCIAPNNENFDFENKVKFKLFLDKDCINLHIKDKEDIDIPLKEHFTNEYDKYIKVFKLNERYKAHKDIVYEMITKAERYPLSRLKELENLTGIPFQQIKKDIFNLIDDDDDLSKKSFSKLTVDISDELGLL